MASFGQDKRPGGSGMRARREGRQLISGSGSVLCGRPLRGKGDFEVGTNWSGAVMCPACSSGAHDRWP
jgi:hypothetical protein